MSRTRQQQQKSEEKKEEGEEQQQQQQRQWQQRQWHPQQHPQRPTSLDPTIAKLVASYLTYPLPLPWHSLLPQEREFVSAAEEVLQASSDGSVSLPGLQRTVRDALNSILQENNENEHEFQEPRHPYNDAGGYLRVYTKALLGTIDEKAYSKHIPKTNMASKINIPELWRRHQHHLQGLRSACGDYDTAVLGDANISNPCYISHILAWAAGEWRLTLREKPAPSDTKNYPSISACPASLATPLDKMRPILSLSTPSRPAEVVLPLLAIVRADELQKASFMSSSAHPSTAPYTTRKASTTSTPSTNTLLALASLSPRPRPVSRFSLSGCDLAWTWAKSTT